MDNIQINGQRRWGPPQDWKGPPPPHGTEIFIKNLPESVLEFDLFKIFSYVGTVYEVRLPVHWSGTNRGYAFIRFTTVAEADRAIKCFDMHEIIHERFIKVERSVDNTRLFLSAVPKEKNAEEVKADLQTVVENIKKVYVYPTMENRSIFRGYAFVEFETHRDAAIAKRILTSDVCTNLFEKKCVAAWANPLPFIDERVMHKLNVLFMRNIPKDLRSNQLKKAMENLLGRGELSKLKRVNDFAFLTFKDHESAKQALEVLKLVPLFVANFDIQIEWAIPKELADYSIKENKCQNSPKLDGKQQLKNSSYQVIMPHPRYEKARPSPELKMAASLNYFGQAENYDEGECSSQTVTFLPPAHEDGFQLFPSKEALQDTDSSEDYCTEIAKSLWELNFNSPVF